MSVVRLTTAAGAWAPVTLMDAQAFARVVDDQDAVVLQRLIEAATIETERYTGLVLLPGTFRVSWDVWTRRLELPIAPVTALTSVSYQREDGTTAALASVTDYWADLGARPARLSFTSQYGPWGLRDSSGIEAVVTAGYATVQEVPADVQQHVITLALLMFEHRDDTDALVKVRRYAAQGSAPFSPGAGW